MIYVELINKYKPKLNFFYATLHLNTLNSTTQTTPYIIYNSQIHILKMLLYILQNGQWAWHGSSCPLPPPPFL